MATRDNMSDLGFASSYGPASPNSTQTGTTVDTANFDSVTLLADFGVGGITFDTNNYIGVKWETSSDGVTWNGVGQSDVLASYGTTVAVGTGGIVRTVNSAHATADAKPTKLGYAGGNRYHRASPVFTGTHASGTPIYLGFMLGSPHFKPVA